MRSNLVLTTLGLFAISPAFAADPKPPIPRIDGVALIQKGPAAPTGTPVLTTVPFQGQAVAAAPSTTIKIVGSEFELLTLTAYTGPVTWDVSTSDGSAPPIVWFECEPKSVIIGVRATQTDPAKYTTPDTPTVAIYCKGTGRAVISAWGVVDNKPQKLAQKVVDASSTVVPPTPLPADELTAPIQAAYAAETNATKAADKAALAAVYLAAIDGLGSVSTAGDVFALLKGATEARIDGRLKTIRAILGTELGKILADDVKTPLTAPQKDAVTKLLKRFSNILTSEIK